jgi:hypothetical protein
MVSILVPEAQRGTYEQDRCIARKDIDEIREEVRRLEMNVSELIEHLKTLPQDIPVMVRIPDPCGGPDYWVMTKKDIVVGDVLDGSDENEREIQAVRIGDRWGGMSDLKPHPVWFGKYACFGKEYGEREECSTTCDEPEEKTRCK